MNRIINNPLIIVITGIAIGWIFYSGLVAFFENRLENKIINANWLSQTIEKDPSLSGVEYKSESFNALFSETNRDRLAWRVLTISNILESDAAISDVGLVSKAFFKDGLNIDRPNDINSIKSLRLLIDLLQFVGNGPNNHNVNDKLEKELATALSRQSIISYDKYLKSSQQAPDSYNEQESESIIHDILNRLFFHLKVEENFTSIPELDPFVWNKEGSVNDNALSGTEELRQLRELSLQILTSIYDDPKVSNAKTWLENIKGPEQNVMFCMFFIGLFILLRKKIASSRKFELDDDLTKRLKLYYTWIFSSLTAVGFIGTIRGLSQALSSADVIFKSSPGLEQAISISQIAEVLGIAFATTLIALVLTLVLGLIRLLLDPTDQFKIDEA